ncbi:MAG: glycerophosphodiester phosphodiesterase family protein [Anaerolineales bacterium]|nr:glycerophosphodiester phosphodiesterase family protein [Anaerolineales bacterium]
MFSSLHPPFYFAHRGASAHAPENTLAAFRLAREQGALAIEFDVKLTADRHVVVHHDVTLDRTTDGSGPLHRYPLAALRELDAGGKFSPQFRGEKIPTLEEVFETVGRDLFLNIELTNYATPFDGLVDAVAALVRKHRMEERVLFSSFFPTNLMRAEQLLPSVPRGQLSLPGGAGWWQRAAGSLLRLHSEHPWKEDVTAESVRRAHARARRVYVWTVNAPTEMQSLRALGVDAIFTDDPLLANQHFCA